MKDSGTARANLLATDVGDVHDQAMKCLANGTTSDMSHLPQSYFPCLDSRPNAGQSWQGTEVPFNDINLIRAWCQRRDVQPVAVIQAAWVLVLQRYLGNPHVCFAVDKVRGEDHLHECNLPHERLAWVAARLEQHTKPSELLQQVSIRRAEPPDNPAIGERLSSQAGGRTPKFPADTCLLYRVGEHDVRPGLDESSLRRYLANDQMFKVIVYLDIGPNNMFVGIYYLDSVLSLVSAANVAGVYASAIEQLLAHNEGQPLSHINLLTQRDLNQVCKWNRRVPQKVNACVHELVLEHASSRPQSPAIDSWDGQLTYRDLDSLSCRLAKHFVQAGIQPEDLVPICFTKSFYAVATMLAVHRAGGAFIPLDASHPTERLKTIIHKANAKIIVACPDTADRFIGSDLTVITVSADMVGALQADAATRLPQVKTYDAAFVLFTSGSTGQPKGIVQEHASVCTSAVRHGKVMDMTKDSRVFQYAAFAFDVSMMDIFSTLICGGCICIPSEKDRLGDFASTLNSMRANWVLFTPSVASLLKPEDVPSLKTLVFGGEAVKHENLDRWYGKVKLLNCYGPAECCACAIGTFDTRSLRPSNIGRQFDAGLNWVVDSENHDRLVPIGSVGELVVEGPTLARGYLNDLDKTKASFFKNPSWSGGTHGTRRLYKTGDLVRQNSDGTFEFVGRKDHQLKIRGQRVELGEIEHHLANYPGIALSAVLKPQGGVYAQYLLAVIQLQQPQVNGFKPISGLGDHSVEARSATSSESTAIISFLKSLLPPYMIPQYIMVVEGMPLSLSGKIDRRAVEAWLQGVTRLPEPESQVVCNGLHELISKDDHIAIDICAEVSSMLESASTETDELLMHAKLPLSTIALNSIQFIALTMFIRKRFGVKIGLEILTHPTATICSIAKAVRAISCYNGTGPVESKVDARDFFRVQRTQALRLLNRDIGRPRNVFLTGATGFLGCRVLYVLCQDVNTSKVVVHVRKSSSERGSDEPFHRLVRTMQKRGWWRDDFSSKIEVWAGDLAKPRLGLDFNQWLKLCGHGSPDERISAIIHNGAIVNWNATFDTLKATNVDSTIELLKAAAESPVLDQFVFVSGGQQLRFDVDDEAAIAEEVIEANGYAQSKFLSELLVKDYASKVAPTHQQVTVVKPGYIIGTLDDGVAPAGDYMWRLVATCVFNGSYNAADATSWLFVSDVDRIAATIVEACSSPRLNHTQNQEARVVKILDGLPVQQFWDVVQDELGCEMKALPSETWMERVDGDVEKRREQHPLWPLLLTLEKNRGLIGTSAVAHPKVIVENSRLIAALMKNVEYFKSTGFVHKPEGNGVKQNGYHTEARVLAEVTLG